MKRLMASFRNAGRGIGFALKGRTFKIQLCFAFYVIIAGLVTEISKTEWLVLLILIGLVLSLECLNTSIEVLCDTFHPEYSPGVGKMKDLAAGGVLIASLVSAAAGACIFFSETRFLKAAGFAAGHPLAAGVILACLPLWIYVIFGRKTHD